MPTRKLLARFIETVQPEEAQTDYRDESVKGFGLRVSPKGRKTWYLQYRVQRTGKQRLITIGTFPNLSLEEARKQAQEMLRNISNDRDPSAEKRHYKDGLMYGKLCDMYIERYAKVKKKSWPKDASMINRYLRPAFADRLAEDIKRKEFVALFEFIRDKQQAPIMANRTLEVARVMYNWAIKAGELEHNPCALIEKPAKENARERVLTSAEIAELWCYASEYNSAAGDVMRLLLLTGQRKSEVCLMRIEELDMQRSCWTIPVERSKNGKSHEVPLTDTAVDIVSQHIVARTTGPVFIAPSGKGLKTLDKFSASMRQKKQFTFEIHDVRRTVTNQLAKLGIDRFIIQRIINHTDRSVTATYDRHTYFEEKKKALMAY